MTSSVCAQVISHTTGVSIQSLYPAKFNPNDLKCSSCFQNRKQTDFWWEVSWLKSSVCRSEEHRTYKIHVKVWVTGGSFVCPFCVLVHVLNCWTTWAELVKLPESELCVHLTSSCVSVIFTTRGRCHSIVNRCCAVSILSVKQTSSASPVNAAGVFAGLCQ